MRAYARDNYDVFYRSDTAHAGLGCSSTTWVPISSGPLGSPEFWSRSTIAVDPSNYQRVVFVRSTDIAVSTNGGDSFTYRTLPSTGWPSAVHISSEGLLIVGTRGDGAYSSWDDGASWAPFGLNGAAAPVVITAIASTPPTTKTHWLATTAGLYRKIGSGSWSVVTGGGGYIVNDVAVDPNCQKRVYAALGFGGVQQQHGGGIRVTTDNGTTWDSITSGWRIHMTPVTDVEVDTLEPRYVYASTYGRGFWYYDWGSSLPACQ